MLNVFFIKDIFGFTEVDVDSLELYKNQRLEKGHKVLVLLWLLKTSMYNLLCCTGSQMLIEFMQRLSVFPSWTCYPPDPFSE